MINQEIIRQNLPAGIEVYVQDGSRNLSQATQMLSEDVLGELNETRDSILTTFGHKSFPSMKDEALNAIGDYFSEKGWSIPSTITINPDSDALELRNIYQKAKYRLPDDEVCFTGANDSVISEGASPQLDLVILHDVPTRHFNFLNDILSARKIKISKKDRNKVNNMQISELIVHEYAHLAGQLAVSAIVLEKTDGKLNILDRSTRGFKDIKDDIRIAELNEDSGFYNGPALNEGWAALNASRFLLSQYDLNQQKEARITDLSIPYRYFIWSNIRTSLWKNTMGPIVGLSSGDTGMVIEKLDEIHPGTIETMEQVADGTKSLEDCLCEFRSRLSPKVMKLLQTPNIKAWHELRKLLEV